MRPALYIFLNRGLGMSVGKAASQATQAAVEAYRLSCGLLPHQPQTIETYRETAFVRNWYKGGHHAVYTMDARDAEQLRSIERYLNDRGFPTVMHVDEGLTEDTEFVPTALASGLVDKDHAHVQATFGQFKLYTGSPTVILECTGKMQPDDYRAAKRLVEKGKIEQAKRLCLVSEKRPKLHTRIDRWLSRLGPS